LHFAVYTLRSALHTATADEKHLKVKFCLNHHIRFVVTVLWLTKWFTRHNANVEFNTSSNCQVFQIQIQIQPIIVAPNIPIRFSSMSKLNDG